MGDDEGMGDVIQPDQRIQAILADQAKDGTAATEEADPSKDTKVKAFTEQKRKSAVLEQVASEERVIKEESYGKEEAQSEDQYEDDYQDDDDEKGPENVVSEEVQEALENVEVNQVLSSGRAEVISSEVSGIGKA